MTMKRIHEDWDELNHPVLKMPSEKGGVLKRFEWKRHCLTAFTEEGCAMGGFTG